MLKYPVLIFDVLILVCLIVIAGMVQVLSPSEIQWDLANYHYYNAWAFLKGRLGYDIAPAMVNTYFNPLLDVPHYLMMKTWGDDALVKFVQGSYYGILAFVFYKIVGIFFDFRKEPLAFLATFLIGITGYSSFSQLGISSNEVQVSILILCGFYIVLKHIRAAQRSKWVWLVSGLLMGGALGLKPTVVIYCVALGITLIVCAKPLAVNRKEIILFAVCGLGGYLLTNGWWMWQLYSKFDNPFFPFLNNIFHSDYFGDFSFRDIQYISKTTWWQKLFLPVLISFKSYDGDGYLAENSFWDLRYALTYFIALFLFIRWLCQGRKLPEKHYLLLYVFLLFSFMIWAYLFSIMRYIIPVEMLSAIIIVKFFQKLTSSSIVGGAILLSLKIIGFYALVSEVPYYLAVWGNSLPFMKTEKINLPENALVKTYGFPIAMVAAQLVGDQSNRIVAYANGDVGENIDFLEQKKLSQVREEIVNKHQGPVVALITYNLNGQKAAYFKNAQIRRKELEKEGMYCRVLQSYVDIVDICVPQELKEQIFVEPEKHRELRWNGDAEVSMDDRLKTYLRETNKILNK